jgi:hypothetical protein
MRHAMAYLNCIYRRGATHPEVAHSMRPASVWLRRTQEEHATPGVSKADPVPVRTGATGAYDAVDQRLMDRSEIARLLLAARAG